MVTNWQLRYGITRQDRANNMWIAGQRPRRIHNQNNQFKVPSQRENEGNHGPYITRVDNHHHVISCTCEDWRHTHYRGGCKHMLLTQRYEDNDFEEERSPPSDGEGQSNRLTPPRTTAQRRLDLQNMGIEPDSSRQNRRRQLRF